MIHSNNSKNSNNCNGSHRNNNKNVSGCAKRRLWALGLKSEPGFVENSKDPHIYIALSV